MKVITGSGFAAALLFSGSAALTAPTYLCCEFATSKGTSQVFNFALDEAAGTFGVYAPASGSQRREKGTFTDGKASLNEGSVAWEIDIAKGSVIRDKRMVGEKDGGTCKTISHAQSGFED
ncbi:UNVERIFIED_ORG: hypothetical protein QE446_000011 [Rhizobium sp. SORGH_AS260]|uniref:hypothetical protein n=1 Tax=Agrobacterium TaxID=357 RepID=UPI001FCD12AC|nr:MULTISPECIES: hypothetical protein [Agrobacterium]MCJ2875396.1 hypothetical protein [Agrobacterium pusense]MDP9731794.1 hypothetical protein [Rhizobium sp. SORGH_AS_0285]MDP9752154.1 hypothetical protein [Rhizobium sp. SORGH_AS_0260]MDR6079110.1 hypothetical protein [Agrobacterium sp. SORGH_AS_0440]